MPAEKTELHTGGYFVAVKDDPTVWKCVPCSENTSSGKISTFLRNKPGRHTKTVKHQNAVKEYLAKPRAPPHAGSNSNNAPGPAATMSLPETFSAHEVLGRSDSNDGSPRYNPLDHIHDDGDHGFVDDAGHEIRLSAGATPEEDSRARIRREVGNLLGNAFVEHGDWGARVAGIAESESVMDEEEARPTIADAVAELHLAGLADDPEDDENTFEMPLPGYEHVHSDPQWHPYTSKTMFILDLLDNLPRLRLSDDHMKVFIWALKECGALNVPTFTNLRAQQARLTKEMNIQTTHHVSAQSNHFYANCPSETTRLDFANPLVRPHMSFLPRVGAPVSEFYDGGKCLELDEKALDCGQLMWMDKENAPRRHFYIRELARLRDGRFVIPVRFVQDKNVDCLDGYLVVHYAATDIFVVRDHALIRVEAKELQDNVVDIERETEIRINDSAPSWVAKNRHPVRAIAAQRPAYTVRLMSWSDDVSGNKSKQYNAHTNVYTANINLPHDKLKQEYFVRFCSTSQHASSSEQLEILAKDTGPDRWHTAYDCALHEEVLFRLIPHVFPADNPQQSEHTSHIGGNGNKPCRACRIGGTAEEREQEEQYETFFQPGRLRSAEYTVNEIKSQLWIAGLGVQDTIDLMQSHTGVKDKTAQYWIDILIKKARAMQQERITSKTTMDPRLKDRRISRDPQAKQDIKATIMNEIQHELHEWLVQQPPHHYDSLPLDSPERHALRPGDHYNVLLGLPGVEIHLDTPCEILHTFLLGQDKYLWHTTNSPWDKRSDELFASRLRGSSVDGLSLPPIRADYLLKYKNSLVGKHFKALQQVGAFHLYGGLCPDIVRDLWKATGELGAVLWFSKIRDMDQYTADLEILIANVLDIWAIIDPNRILTKNKLHILTHLIANIRRFGPAILYSTEIFECWNAIFRFCSILSNHQAPSRDIAVTLADMERFKHQVSGGWWRNSTGEYIRAGDSVRAFFKENVTLQHRLGWVEHVSLPEGSVRLEAQAKRCPSSWADATQSLGEVQPPPSSISHAPPASAAATNSGTQWQHCKYLISQSTDVCKPESWVFFKASQDRAAAAGRDAQAMTHSSVMAGRISKILSPIDGGEAVAIIKPFDIADKCDEYLNMPVLTPHDGPVCLVAPKDVLFIFNAQHDCRVCGCSATAPEAIIQERLVTARTRSAVKHTDKPRYLLNMHALHNGDLIRETLPRNLTEPKYYIARAYRQAKHSQIARGLHLTGTLRRKQAAAKAAETRARNKEARARADAATAHCAPEKEGPRVTADSNGEPVDRLVNDNDSDVDMEEAS